jgi:hypothetical protein
MNEALREFDLGDGHDVDLDEHISTIEALSDELSDEDIARLWAVLQGRAQAMEEYGADFDLGYEVQMQIMAVRAMRNAIMPGGVVRVGTPAREIKEVVTASSTLLNTLMKTHERIMSLDRQRAIEEAVTTSIQTLPDEQKKQFLATLEENLSAIT